MLHRDSDHSCLPCAISSSNLSNSAVVKLSIGLVNSSGHGKLGKSASVTAVRYAVMAAISSSFNCRFGMKVCGLRLCGFFSHSFNHSSPTLCLTLANGGP